MATTYLTKAISSAGSRTKATLSLWVKRGSGFGNDQRWFSYENTSVANNVTVFKFAGNSIQFADQTGGSNNARYDGTRVLKDASAWYHFVAKMDTTQSTNTDRLKIYINGELQSEGSYTYPTQDSDLNIGHNSNAYIDIGRWRSSDNQYFDGNIAHYHYCDGYAYDASSFGETDSTSGIWVAKTSPSVSYGTNGYFLKFQDTSAFGDDSSGNNNDYTVSGTMTQTKDTPDNNFCTWNPLSRDHNETYTFQNGNTICLIPSAGGWSGTNGTLSAGAGKWYCEGKINYTPGAYNTTFGFTSTKLANQKGVYGQIGYGDKGSSVLGWGVSIGIYDTGTLLYSTEGAKEQSTASWAAAWASGDILMFAVDIDNGKFYFGKNGTWDSTSSSNPTAGTGGASFLPSGLLYTLVTTVYREKLQMNFGNGYFETTADTSAEADGDGYGAFEYAPPTGYYALCTQNIKNYG